MLTREEFERMKVAGDISQNASYELLCARNKDLRDTTQPFSMIRDTSDPELLDRPFRASRRIVSEGELRMRIAKLGTDRG